MGFCRPGISADLTLGACGDLIARRQLQPAALSNAYYLRALVWRDRKDSERQLADLNEAVRLDSSNAKALVARGILMRERKAYDLARRDLDAAIAADAKNAAAFFERAKLKREQGDREGAVDDYTQSLKVDPNQVAAHNNRGYVRRDRKELALALDDFEEALRISPNSPNGHLGRGEVLADRGDLTGAIAEFTTAIAINPRWTDAYFQRSFALLKSGDKAGALADLDAVVRIDSKSAAAYFQRANLKREQGDNEGALNDYTESLKIDPNQVAAHNNRGYIRRDRKELALALEDFEEALRISPSSPNGHLGRGMVLADRGNQAGAIAEFTNAISINPRWPDPYVWRAFIRKKAYEYDGALADLAEALRLNPNNAIAYADRGIIKRLVGDLDGALSDFNQAIQIDSTLVDAYTNRGLVYEAKADTQRARADFQKAVSLPVKGDTGAWGNATAKSRLAALSAPQKKYDPGASDTEIRIGNTMPYTGAFSAYGIKGQVESAYFKMLNEQGGINGRKINFISYDDGFSPSKAVEQTLKLIERDEVLFMFNSLGTPTNSATMKYMNGKKVPQLFVATGATKFSEDPTTNPWTMGWQPSYQTEGRIYAKYILVNHPNAKIGVLYENDEYGKDLYKGLKDGLGDKAKTMIVADASYEVTDAKIDSQIARLKLAGADLFVDITSPKFAPQAIKKLVEIGWKPIHILNNVSASVGAVLRQPGLENGLEVLSAGYLKDVGDPRTRLDPSLNHFFLFLDKYMPDADPSNLNVASAYAVAESLVQVLQQCGDELTRENVMKQATNLKDFRSPIFLEGIKVNTSPSDYFVLKQLQMMKFNGQSWELFGPILTGGANS